MSAYRFCRTDDITLLVEALNRCWTPFVAGMPPMTPAVFKRAIRDLQVWCSSCMVAFAGHDPVGVLIGAKRSSGTLVHTIAVHPEHRRQGHGRHLLASLGSKLAILGPPRLVAEVPDERDDVRGLFAAAGYVEEARLTDFVLDRNGREVPEAHEVRGFVIPVTVDDIAANGLLDETPPQVCWERSVEALTAKKADIAGLAIASDERIEAYVLYLTPDAGTIDIAALRSTVDDNGMRLKHLLARLHGRGERCVRLPKVHPAELSTEALAACGLRATAGHVRYAAQARAA